LVIGRWKINCLSQTAGKKVDLDDIEIVYECNILNSVAMKKILQFGRVSSL